MCVSMYARECAYEREQSGPAVPALAWQNTAFACLKKQTVLIWQRGSHLADLMVAPTGSISVCKHRARKENGVYIHKTSWIFYHVHPHPQPLHRHHHHACSILPPFSRPLMHTCTYMFFRHMLTQTRTRTSRRHLSTFFEFLSDWSVPSLSLLQLRCFLFCQNASLQVNSDLKTSSPWGCLQHSLLSSFKRNLSRSLLSAPHPLLTLLAPPRPTPSSVQFCSLPASSCCSLSPAR